MKIRLFVALGLSLFLMACSGEFNSFSTSENSLLTRLMMGVWGDENLGVKKKSGPEKVVEKFALYLASGDCDKALKLAIGNARESVQGTIDAGCEPYETEIKTVTCDVNGNIALCQCEEKRLGMDMTYNYDMRKVGKKWKVEDYHKDIEMDLDEDVEATPREDKNSK